MLCPVLLSLLFVLLLQAMMLLGSVGLPLPCIPWGADGGTLSLKEAAHGGEASPDQQRGDHKKSFCSVQGERSNVRKESSVLGESWEC